MNTHEFKLWLENQIVNHFHDGATVTRRADGLVVQIGDNTFEIIVHGVPTRRRDGHEINRTLHQVG